MSGHSKWSTIKHKKAKEDAKRGKVFTKMIREITVAAREGGGDPGSNARLRLLIDKAKQANMPQDNIVRAIKKGTGELAGETYEAITYEGYGPEGVAIMVETLTDNKKRTVAVVRHAFSKLGGNLGEAGAVAWMFEHKGVIRLAGLGVSDDDVLEKLIDYNVDDVKVFDSLISVLCPIADLETVKKGAQTAGLTVEAAEIEWVAKDPIAVDASKEEKIYKFLDAIEDLDDVQNVFSNLV